MSNIGLFIFSCALVTVKLLLGYIQDALTVIIVYKTLKTDMFIIAYNNSQIIFSTRL